MELTRKLGSSSSSAPEDTPTTPATKEQPTLDPRDDGFFLLRRDPSHRYLSPGSSVPIQVTHYATISKLLEDAETLKIELFDTYSELLDNPDVDGGVIIDNFCLDPMDAAYL